MRVCVVSVYVCGVCVCCSVCACVCVCVCVSKLFFHITCSTQCDIWTVGITVIELAEMQPPMFDLHPMG